MAFYMNVSYLWLLGALVLNAAANVALKVGASRGVTMAGFPSARWAADHALVGLGLFLFAANVVLYTIALQRVSLSLAYPTMVVGSLLVITAASAWYLHEQVTAIQLVGAALALAGVVLISLNRS
jgi:multidrug transporter EmrE-like cation transporter